VLGGDGVEGGWGKDGGLGQEGEGKGLDSLLSRGGVVGKGVGSEG